MTDTPASPTRPSVGRSIAVVVLSVLTVLFLVLSVVGVWAARSALDTDVFVSRVGPLASDGAVQQALSDYLTDEVLTAVDVESFLAERLPPPADLLAKPLSAALRQFVDEQVRRVLATPEFASVWERVTTDAHTAFVAVASGADPDVATTTDDGKLVVNLIPAIGEVFESLSGASPELVDRVTGVLENLANDPPQRAVAALEEATGITLPDNFGVVVVDDGGALRTVGKVVEAVRAVVVALLVGFVVCAVAALALSRRRSRTLAQLLGGGALAVALVRQVVLWARDELVGSVVTTTNREAVSAVATSVLESLLTVLAVVLFVIIALAVGMWALHRREVIATLFAGGSDGVAAGWWRPAAPAGAQVGVVAAGVVVLWWFGPALWLAALVVVAVVVAELVLWRSGRPVGVTSAV